MGKNLELIELYDIYSKLLTKKQQEIFSQYYLYDLSLREIAENKEISYQAVRDSLQKSMEMLESYENIMHMKKLYDNNLKLENIIKNSNDLNLKRQEMLEILNSNKDSEDDI